LAELLDAPHETRIGEGIIAIQPRGAKAPLYFGHSLGGEFFYCEPLARLLDPDQPVYGISPCGADGRFHMFPTLEALAAHHVEQLCRFQPGGAFRLAGYSFAGMLVYEIARQLAAKGREVKLLAIYDIGPNRRRKTSPVDFLRTAAAFLWNV